ncbi:MAG: hypothetical protein KatS3mg054_0663 [Chloroflexus sp.]|nr:MAG: hypothetical protein KatS3mg054_0663 [Chloroflexus sp.]
MADFKIGATLAGMVNIETLGLPAPRSKFEFGERVERLDGSVIELGWRRAEWHFPILTMTQRSALRGYCTGSSAEVYIRTLNNDGAYGNYRAVMIWPEEEDQKSGRVFDLRIKFNLVATA